MVVILSLSIGVGVWIPYVLGKSVALITVSFINYPSSLFILVKSSWSLDG